MFEITALYEGQGRDVSGLTFESKQGAVACLREHGYRPDRYNKGEWSRSGATRAIGCLGASVTQYVKIVER